VNASDPTGLLWEVNSMPPGPLADAAMQQTESILHREQDAREANAAAAGKTPGAQTKAEGEKHEKDKTGLQTAQEETEKEEKRQQAEDQAKKQAVVYFSTTKREASGEVGPAPTARYGVATLVYWDGANWQYSQYDARSGSFMSNGSYSYKPANPGEYEGDWNSLRNRSKGTIGENVSMYDELGFGFSINIKALDAPGVVQTNLEFHPDGGQSPGGAFTPNNGTAGCIGVNTKDSQRFLMDLGNAVSVTGNPIFRVVVLP